ncbi:tetratricopeptide repeat protein [Roseimaritima ulvae]|uniref:Tetratricopeptide repeat protein n=1 Tax=Roseimaritima ulvae TaxID=980254 RepID=A0A5B9QUN6_9BACT|nr:tetratricopeptide repeat protein [Roseimaritima ulvae]QEG42724.1 hypothetical protein UC8_47660 [Roseimaritima ulvae]
MSTAKQPHAAAPASGLSTGLIVAAAIAAIGAFATLFSVWARTTTPGLADTLRIASAEYAAGRPAVAAQLAQSVTFPEDFEDQELIHLREFLIGAGIAAAADPEQDRAGWRLAMHEAIPHLQTAASYGFPPGREAEGKRLLGEALLSKGQFSAAAEQLGTAIEAAPALRLQLMPMLIESQLLADDIPPRVALQSVDSLLQWLAPKSPGYFDALMMRGRVLAEQQQWPQARQQFRQVIDECPDAQRVRDAQLLEAASQVSEAVALQEQIASPEPSPVVMDILEAAMQTLVELEREPDPLFAARAKLWIAQAYRTMQQSAAAITAATAVRQHRPFNAESIAGGTLEVELLAEQQMGQEALQTTRYLIREIGDPRLFDGRIVRLSEFRRRLTAAADRLRHAGMYQVAVDLARALPPVVPNDEALMLEAIALSDWGDETLRAGRAPTGEIPTEVAAEARRRYHAAGDAYAAAAQARFTTPDYVPTLWTAITAYEKSRDFEHTLELLEPYLRYEDRGMKPRGLITQGRALLALDRPGQALDPLIDCIVEHPRDSLRYEARLIAAMAHAERNELAEARQLLDDNLYDGTLAPESPVWRDSLYLLGQLLYRDAYRNHMLLTENLPEGLVPAPAEPIGFRENQVLLENAIQRLEETAQREQLSVSENRVKDDAARLEALSRAQHANYLAARSRQMAAHWPAVQAQAPDLLDTARRRLNQTREEHLEKAMLGFKALREKLARREEDQPLSEQELSLMRNCFLAEADVLRESGQWEQAAEAYRGISLRYMNQPAALEAMLGQAHCMESLGKTREAKLIIRQAERVLQRIPPSWDGQFVTTTRYDRQQWQRLLAWMAPPEADA